MYLCIKYDMALKYDNFQNSLLFIIFGHFSILTYNEDMTERLKLKKHKYNIREKQKKDGEHV